MEERTKELNSFLNNVFSLLLINEEKILKERLIGERLSMKETHLIERLVKLEKIGDNGFSSLARVLCISKGSLTTAINTLVKKGYIIKETSQSDRRAIFLKTTKKCDKVNQLHSELHDELVSYIVNNCQDFQTEALTNALKSIEEFFLKGGYNNEYKISNR